MEIFISYAREDSQTANRLYHDLLSIEGVTPWLDSKKLLPGDRWKMEVMHAVKTCDIFLLLLSRNSVSKAGFVQREVSEALEKLKTIPPDTVFVIPARLEDCHPRHPELHDLQWVDLFPDWDSGCALIEKAIRKRMGEPSVHSSVPTDTVIETIVSPAAFTRRLAARGEMRGCDAMELDFRDQTWRGIDFSGVNFVRCEFSGCDFRKSNLKGANFEGAVFRRCLFAEADLWGVNFWGASIMGIKDLPCATLAHTNAFGTQRSEEQTQLLQRSPDIIWLGDYTSFVNYFSQQVGMTEQMIGTVFVWLNHRYFRLMFGKNSDLVFRRGITHIRGKPR